MISAFEARALSEMARIAKKTKSIEIASTICKEAEEQIVEAVSMGNNEVCITYPSDLLNPQFSITDFRSIVKEYFGKYGYEVTVPTPYSHFVIRW